jgi:hypothetical protein
MVDLLFGVPLGYTVREVPSIIPPFLRSCIAQIEAKGLDKEGLYRVSGKAAERDRLRLELEADYTKFDFENTDVHILTGLVKAFFRELPEPLFYFPTPERAAYSNIVDATERLQKLKQKLVTIPRNNLSVLKFLLEHLLK